MLGYHLGVDIGTIIDYYLYQNVSSLTQNAVRAIPLGQTAGQKWLHKWCLISKKQEIIYYHLMKATLV